MVKTNFLTLTFSFCSPSQLSCSVREKLNRYAQDGQAGHLPNSDACLPSEDFSSHLLWVTCHRRRCSSWDAFYSGPLLSALTSSSSANWFGQQMLLWPCNYQSSFWSPLSQISAIGCLNQPFLPLDCLCRWALFTSCLHQPVSPWLLLSFPPAFDFSSQLDHFLFSNLHHRSSLAVLSSSVD